MSGEKIIVPRNFYLLAELEKAEHGKTDMSVSMGLSQSDDIMLTDWNCTILGPPGTPVENRILSLSVHCGPKYPLDPPKVKFLTKANLNFVDKDGNVQAEKLKHLKGWDRLPVGKQSIEGTLLAIRHEFSQQRSLQQPAEGTTY